MEKRTIVNALIEIPLNSRNKYEIDYKSGRIRLDRVLYSAMDFPTEYGIVENTKTAEGNPLDILVICKEPSFPGCIVPACVLGYFEVLDRGKRVCKLISVIDCDPHYDNVRDLSDIPSIELDRIRNNYENYKAHKMVEVQVGTFHNKKAAFAMIEECKNRYQATLSFNCYYRTRSNNKSEKT